MTRVPVLSFSGHCANDRGRRSLDFISDLVADGGDEARCRMHRLPDIDCLEALHRRAGAGRRASPAHDGGELNSRPRGLRLIYIRQICQARCPSCSICARVREPTIHDRAHPRGTRYRRASGRVCANALARVPGSDFGCCALSVAACRAWREARRAAVAVARAECELLAGR
jgi:hypothetical protein